MRSPDDELWRNSLDEEIGDDLAAESLAGMLAYARRRRRRRKVLGVSAVAGALALLLCVALRSSNPPRHPLAVAQPSSNSTSRSENPGHAQIHFLTDEELLSRFPDRPVALIGPPGERRLVFLDDVP